MKQELICVLRTAVFSLHVLSFKIRIRVLMCQSVLFMEYFCHVSSKEVMINLLKQTLMESSMTCTRLVTQSNCYIMWVHCYYFVTIG